MPGRNGIIRAECLQPANRKALRFIALIAALLLVVNSGRLRADQPLMTLSVESSIVPWQNEFILTLTIYLPADLELPEVMIDGLDQFELRSTGRNLLQVPRGKTQKWILTYTLTATQEGSFKVGPAALTLNEHRYYSNTLFIKVNPPIRRAPPKKQAAEEEAVKTQEAEKPDESKVTPPVVLSAAEIGDRILVRMDATPERPFRSAGVVVTLQLLAQLPVENLRFLDDPNFPGFLKYDFPFTAHPKAQKIKHRGEFYAAYELLRFLIFPLNDGEITIPPVRCEMKVRVPSGTYSAADPVYDLERVTNTLQLMVRPVPDASVVGNFVLSNAILDDSPQSKVVRLSLEGTGQLSTFDFPEIEGAGFRIRPAGGFIQASIEGESLQSKKVQDLQILPVDNTTSIVLPEVHISQFHPGTRRRSVLKLPTLPLRFSPPAPIIHPPVPFPNMIDRYGRFVPWFPAITAILFLAFHFRPARSKKPFRLAHIFARKNDRLNISRTAAQRLYQHVTALIAEQDGDAVSLTETLKRHLPQEEWLTVDRTFRKLEWIAFSPFRNETLTYAQMKEICERMERRWIA